MSCRGRLPPLLAGALLVMATMAYPGLQPTDKAAGASGLRATNNDAFRPFNARLSDIPVNDSRRGDCLAIEGQFPGFWGVQRSLPPGTPPPGQARFDFWIPKDAPTDLGVSVFLKDKDGLWFQCRTEQPLHRGAWQSLVFDLSPASADVQPAGTRAVWNGYYSSHVADVGVGVFSAADQALRVAFSRIEFLPVAGPPVPLRICAVQELTPHPATYTRYELAFDLSRTTGNPFNPEEVAVDAVFRTPSGTTMTVPAFYYQPYARRLDADEVETVEPSGPASWRVRFTPLEPGHHTWRLQVRARGERLETAEHAFNVSLGEPHGFVRVSKHDPRYFETADGKFFYPIGQNIHAPFDRRCAKLLGVPVLPNRGTFAYDHYFEKMAANGGNAAIVWMSNWWVSIEWTKAWPGFNGLTDYNLGNAWRLDYLLDSAEKHGIHVLLVLDNHGKFSSFMDPEWESSPYSVLNGGPCQTPESFFSSVDAFDVYRKRLRYIAARWGAHPALLGFELISELNLVGTSRAFHNHPSQATWVRKACQSLDADCAYRRPITVQYSNDWQTVDRAVASLNELGFLVGDIYKPGGSIVPYVVETARQNGRFGKPTFSAEFGGNWDGTTTARLQADLHAGLWANAMTGTAGAPFFWWFDYIDRHDLYGEFRRLSKFMAGEDRRGQEFQTVEPEVVTQEGVPSAKVSAVAMVSRDGAVRAWVYDRLASEVWPGPRYANEHSGLRLRLPKLSPGGCRVEFWDTKQQGGVTETRQVEVGANGVEISLPTFAIDCAIKVDRLPLPPGKSANGPRP